MEFSIIIPTFENYDYCKLTIDSIKHNSSFNHEIIVHLNGIDDQTENYLKKENILFTKSDQNMGFVQVLIPLTRKVQKNIFYIHMMTCFFT